MTHRPSHPAAARAAYTLIELAMSAAFVAALLLLTASYVGRTEDANAAGAAAIRAEEVGLRTLDRVCSDLRMSDADSLLGVLDWPLHSTSVDYQTAEAGAGPFELGPPCRIALDPARGAVVWTESPALPEERSVTWCTGVAPLARGETLNGLDDDGNGLVDEPGFALTRESGIVFVRLTLRLPGPDGSAIERSFVEGIAARN